MKRFHVHLHVDDLSRSIGFYAKLFDAPPSRTEADYAKWMLDDPPVNFAISSRGGKPGIDHLGIQTDDPAELAAMKARAQAADMTLLDEGATSCCYARSEKHWITDPQGVAWEHFHTLGSIPHFNEGESSHGAAPARASDGLAPAQGATVDACCSPRSSDGVSVELKAASAATHAASSCCAPATAAQPRKSACC